MIVIGVLGHGWYVQKISATERQNDKYDKSKISLLYTLIFTAP